MKQKVTIPESMADLTLGQYQRFLKVSDGNTDELFLRQKMVQIFCDIPLAHVDKISKKDFQEITDAINEVLKENPELTTTFSLNGVEYGFIPSFDDITMGEFVDLDNLTENWEEMQQFMSILYRPITVKKGDKYDIEPYDTELYDFTDLPLHIVAGAKVFFWRLSNALFSSSASYLKQVSQDKAVQEKLSKVSGLDGDGLQTLQTSHKMIFSKLKELSTRIYLSASII